MSAEKLCKFLQETLLKDPYCQEKYGESILMLLPMPTPVSGPTAAPGPIKASVPSIARESPRSPSPPIRPTSGPRSPTLSQEIPPLERRSWRDPPASLVKAVAKRQSRERSRSPIEMHQDDLDLVDEMSEDAADASDDYDTVTSSSYSSDEDYTVVKGRKRKKAKDAPHASKAKKPVVASSTPPPLAATSAVAQPAPATAIPRSSRPPSPKTDSNKDSNKNPIKNAKRPPPVYLQDKSKWNEVSNACVVRKINFTNATSCQQGIKIQVASSRDYRSLTLMLQCMKLPFHTYSLPEETPTRVVIRRVPKEIPTEEIRKDLLKQKVPVIAVHRLHRARGGEQFDMVLVVCDHTEGHNPIFNVTTVCSLKGISIEKPYRPHLVGQCHNCQLYGHSQTNCYANPRCVKCLGNHSTKDCPRPKDISQCTEPPSCVLCGQVGHPANYRGCPKAPKLTPVAAKRFEARQLLQAPSAKSLNPPRLAPQRPSPWGKLNHLSTAPLPNPKPISALMDLSIPAPALSPNSAAQAAPIPAQSRKVATTTAAAASPPQNTTTGSKPRRSVANIIISAYEFWMTAKARALAAEIESAIEAEGELTLPVSTAIFDRYPTITEELDSLVFRNGQWVRK